jgi:hypothetical protein
MFPLANPHKGLNLDFVPKSNPVNLLILLYICSYNLKSAIKDSASENILSFDLGKRLWLDFEV